jgi:hypothetical protein
MTSGNVRANSIDRAGCKLFCATARRRFIVIRDANDRANPPDACGRVGGAAWTARSAHNAVATTITAITCLVRCIRIRDLQIGKVMNEASPVKATPLPSDTASEPIWFAA